MSFTIGQAKRAIEIKDRLGVIERRIASQVGTTIYASTKETNFNWSPSETSRAMINALLRTEFETERAALLAEAKTIGLDPFFEDAPLHG